MLWASGLHDPGRGTALPERRVVMSSMHQETITVTDCAGRLRRLEKDAEEFQRVKVVAVQVDGEGSELLEVEYFH